MVAIWRCLLVLLAALPLVLGGAVMADQGKHGMMIHAASADHHAPPHEECDGKAGSMGDLCCVAACAPLALNPHSTADMLAVEWHLVSLPDAGSPALHGRSVTPLHRPPRRWA